MGDHLFPKFAENGNMAYPWPSLLQVSSMVLLVATFSKLTENSSECWVMYLLLNPFLVNSVNIHSSIIVLGDESLVEPMFIELGEYPFLKSVGC